MHELSLAESVLETIEEAAHRDGFARVKTVWLEIGRLSCVEPEALTFCFDSVVRDTIAAGARLDITAIPGSAWCGRCAATVPMDSLYSACPQCGAYHLAMLSGTEMRVKELEVM
jgi:hydrogenase nickel incorporation protein HypA/HybF